jgi:hypothetical protein
MRKSAVDGQELHKMMHYGNSAIVRQAQNPEQRAQPCLPQQPQIAAVTFRTAGRNDSRMHFRAGLKSTDQTAAGITFFGKRSAAILSSSPFVHCHTYYSIQLRLS